MRTSRHGFPQRWWQWRGVIRELAASGFRTVAPDYRGAGHSLRPPKLRRATIAIEIRRLAQQHLQIEDAPRAGRRASAGHRGVRSPAQRRGRCGNLLRTAHAMSPNCWSQGTSGSTCRLSLTRVSSIPRRSATQVSGSTFRRVSRRCEGRRVSSSVRAFDHNAEDNRDALMGAGSASTIRRLRTSWRRRTRALS